MAQATRSFLDGQLSDLPQYRDFPRTMEEVLKRAQKRFKTMVVSPHWFLPHRPADYVELISRELGWRCPERSYPGGSTNCDLNFLSVDSSMRNFGYTHYHVEASKLIRSGLMTRDEAVAQLHAGFEPALLEEIRKRVCDGK